jgi:hypothetical protein
MPPRQREQLEPTPDDRLPNYSQARLLAMDAEFVAAMTAAIDSNLEWATVGVSTAPGTRRPIHIIPPL